jgi:hypothetical protein
MRLQSCLIPAIGTLALGLFTVPGQAAPAAGLAAGSKIAAGEDSGAEKVHRRYRYYRYYRYYRPYRYWYYGYYRPYRYYRSYRHHRRYGYY